MGTNLPPPDAARDHLVLRRGVAGCCPVPAAEPRASRSNLFPAGATGEPVAYAVVPQDLDGSALEAIVAFPTKDQADAFGKAHFARWTVVPARFRVFRRTLRPPV